MSFLKINGYDVPYPSSDSGLQTIATVVDGGRMADGVFRGQKIGRDQSKVELTWRVLTPEQWGRILSIFNNNFVVSVYYLDAVSNGFVTRNMYVGDRSARPFMWNAATNRPKYYLDCKANLIDTGG